MTRKTKEKGKRRTKRRKRKGERTAKRGYKYGGNININKKDREVISLSYGSPNDDLSTIAATPTIPSFSYLSIESSCIAATIGIITAAAIYPEMKNHPSASTSLTVVNVATDIYKTYYCKWCLFAFVMWWRF